MKTTLQIQAIAAFITLVAIYLLSLYASGRVGDFPTRYVTQDRDTVIIENIYQKDVLIEKYRQINSLKSTLKLCDASITVPFHFNPQKVTYRIKIDQLILQEKNYLYRITNCYNQK